MSLVIAGKIVAMSHEDPDETFKGRVWIGDDGSIDAVTRGSAAGPAGFTSARKLDFGDSWILPGLIDLHNHIGYNFLPLWAEPRQPIPFAHHDSWPRAASYQDAVSNPAELVKDAAPEALLAYVQLRALIGGTTSIQGWPGASRAFLQVLRNVDSEKAGTGSRDLIYTATITETPDGLIERAQKIEQGAGFIYHCSEGQPGSLVAREFDHAAEAGCLRRTFIGIHCNAVQKANWPKWKKAQAGTVVWSPFSNLWLYGSTLDVPSAAKQSVSLSLGSDWGPSGTKHVLSEVKVAKLVSKDQGLGLTDRELVAMVTSNPGDALTRCWSKTVGRLARGAFADLLVLRAKGGGSVWSQLVRATEDEIQLVVCNGVPRYGDASAMTKANAAPSSPITIRGRKRRFAIPDPKNVRRAWSVSSIRERIDKVRKNPGKAFSNANARYRAYAGDPESPQAPLRLVLDMPRGRRLRAALTQSEAEQVVIPPLPSLIHDDAFFGAIRGRGFHGGLLDGLSKFY